MALVPYLCRLGIGAVMPALALLVAVRPSIFSVTMGAFPIFAAATVLFTLAGLRLARDAGGGGQFLHQAARRWVLMGLLLPWLALGTLADRQDDGEPVRDALVEPGLELVHRDSAGASC